MRTATFFVVGLTAALMLAVILSLPASAQPTYGNGFTLLPSSSGLTDPNSPTITTVKNGHGAFHGGFRGGVYFGGGPYGYGYGYGPYSGDGYGYYQEGRNTCVWNGYNYRCYNTYKDLY